MIIPFLNFNGKASEVIAFYETVFDVQNKQVFYFKDMPASENFTVTPEIENYVLHSEMTIEGVPVWIGDTPEGELAAGEMLSLTAVYDSPEKVKEVFGKLSVDGEVFCDAQPTFYSPMYGMVKDRFGIVWSVMSR
ncbi:MAG: VOC family protein [Tannerellaceae bacterium]|jgi:PhnB protein|nr:VOC family protein [Tannerellaceae bacterium]